MLLCGWMDNNLYNLHICHIWQLANVFFFPPNSILMFGCHFWLLKPLPLVSHVHLMIDNRPVHRVNLFITNWNIYIFHLSCIAWFCLVSSVDILSELHLVYLESTLTNEWIVAYRNKRVSTACCAAQKWCRTSAPLAVNTKTFIFHTCLPSILAHVLYHTQGGFLNSIVSVGSWRHFTHHSQKTTSQNKYCSFIAVTKDKSFVYTAVLVLYRFRIFKPRMKTESSGFSSTLHLNCVCA